MKRILALLVLLALPALLLSCAATGADPGAGNLRWVFVSATALTFATQAYDWWVAASADGEIERDEWLAAAVIVTDALERLTGQDLTVKVTPAAPLGLSTTTTTVAP